MPETNSYSREKERLEEIVLQTRAKDVPLEKSLDLYDEALAIGARCVEQLEKTDFTSEELESVAEHPEVELSGAVASSNTGGKAEGDAEGDAADEMEDAASDDEEEFAEDLAGDFAEDDAEDDDADDDADDDDD